MRPRFDLLLLVLPGWLAFALYIPALGHGLVWDDSYFLIDTPFLRDPDLWWNAVRQPLFVSVNYFRPLPLLSFVAEIKLAGVTPFVFHLSNLLLHAANTTLVVLVARTLLKAHRSMPAAVAGIVFATHPALVENVVWISDRFDLMMTFFLLCAFLAEKRLRHAGWRSVATALLFLAALLCKETAIVFLGLLPIWQLMPGSRDEGALQAAQAASKKGLLGVWLMLVAALALYTLLRYAALGYLYQADTGMESGSVLQHALLIGKTLGWYALLALWPFGQLSPVHPAITPIPLSDASAWLGLAGTLMAATCCLGLLRRRPVATSTLLFAMALISLAPVANLVPLTIGDNIVHDRYLILPIALAAIGVSSLLASCAASRKASGLLSLWCIASAVTVAVLIPHWRYDLDLWTWAYQRQPASDIARQNYIAALVSTGHNAETIALATALMQQGPQAISVIHNLALAEARLGQFDLAEQTLARAVSRRPRDTPIGRLERSGVLNLLAFIRMARHRYAEAEAPLREAIRLMPETARPHYNLALVLHELGDSRQGDREMALAVRYGLPESATRYYQYGDEPHRQAQTAPGKR